MRHEKLLGIRRMSNLSTRIDPGSGTNQKCRFCSRWWWKLNRRGAYGSKPRLQEASRAECVTSHIEMSHVTHVTHMKGSRHTWLSQVAYIETHSYMGDTCDTELIQPIADRVAQHLEIVSKNFRFSTRRTRILMGFIMYSLVLIVNPMGRILVRWKSFRNNLEMLCHPICNGLYVRLYLIMCDETLSVSHVSPIYEWVSSRMIKSRCTSD